MISSKKIKIRKVEALNSEYIENELTKLGLDVIRWVITDYNEEYYILNIAVKEG